MNNNILLLHQAELRNKLTTIKTLDDLKEKLIKDCNTTSSLVIKEKSINTVLGDGNINADIMFIGEAPGEKEDQEGIPFVGRSGQLLERILLKYGISRSKVFITNTVFWRPENNRNPTIKEIEICYPYLEKMIEIVNPKMLVLIGKIATVNFFSKNIAIYNLRNNWHNISMPALAATIPTRVIFHPSYVLRGMKARLPILEQDIKEIAIKAKELKLEV